MRGRVDRAAPELVGRLARRGGPHEGRGAALVLHDAHHLPEPLGRHRGPAIGTNKHVAWARALVALAPYELAEHRSAASTLNVNLALDKAHEGKTLKEIIALPPSALQGVAAHADDAWAELGVKSIGDLGSWKFAAAAHAIATLAECEASDVSQHK